MPPTLSSFEKARGVRTAPVVSSCYLLFAHPPLLLIERIDRISRNASCFLAKPVVRSFLVDAVLIVREPAVGSVMALIVQVGFTELR